ncbi:MAG: prolyl oligopeptidase family serine peptidase [Hyphomicrobiales bacterium]|nr:prolyl oligopeptidase family serine peptidase [Hyphomicrobiales bacterium]
MATIARSNGSLRTLYQVPGLCLVLLMALTFATVACELKRYSEEVVEFSLDGRKIVGTLTMPAGAARSPAVLMLHGASRVRDGPPIRGDTRGLFRRAAQIFAESGIASLRISTGGRGGTEGDFRDMTFGRRIDEALAAIDWLSQRADIDPIRISVLGHSQGTIIAAAVAGRLENAKPLAAAVMWAPNTDPLRSYQNSMGIAVFEKGVNAKPGEIVRWRGAGNKMRAFRSGFFRGLLSISTMDEIRAYVGPLLVVTGMRDRISPPTDARRFRKHHPGDHSFADFDVGHRMGASVGLAEVDNLTAHTANWLSANSRH